MNTDLEVHNIVQWALTQALEASSGDDRLYQDLGVRHRHRSMLFVRHLGLLLEKEYGNGQFSIHRKREGEEVDSPRETLHDIDVFEVDETGLIERNIWQVESELAFSFNPKFCTIRP